MLFDKKEIAFFEDKSIYSKKAFFAEALEAIEQLFTCKERVDKLQLFFPLMANENLNSDLAKKMQIIKDKNIKIEIYIKEKDTNFVEFFQKFATIYQIKDKK